VTDSVFRSARLSHLAVLMSTVALVACGGGGDEGATASAAAPSPAPSPAPTPAPTPTPTPAPTPAPSTPSVYVGFFYNFGIQAGGTVGSSLTLSNSQVNGFWDFTQDDAEATVLCGAGTGDMARSGNGFSGTFVSDDPDPGCGFDRNAIVSLTGNIDTSDSHLFGSYGAANSGGSTMIPASGAFEVWKSGTLPLRTCTGTMSIPASSSNVAATTTMVWAGYLGTQVFWGAVGVVNVDRNTGAPIACVTNGTLVGYRNPSTGELEAKLNLTDRTGSACETTSASVAAVYTGTSSGLTLSGSSAGEAPWSLTCETTVTPSAVSSAAKALQAAKQTLASSAR
jgi:hypothetical protein